MGKANGVAKRRRKNRNPTFTHRKKYQKMRSQRLGKNVQIACEAMREQWESGKSVAKNMKEMGLGLNPNSLFPIPKPITQLGYASDALETVPLPKNNKKGLKKKGKKGKEPETEVEDPKAEVVKKLEKEASIEVPKNFKFGPEVVKFCVYLMEKYGEDYEAMARDTKNYYQESPGQIRTKIKKMKRIPVNWNAYLRAKEMVESEEQSLD
jgi:hypothetical protein